MGRLLICVIVVLWVLLTSSVSAVEYRAQNLNIPVGFGLYTINGFTDSGYYCVSGYEFVDGGSRRSLAYRYSVDGSKCALEMLGGYNSFASDMNEQGYVVGTSSSIILNPSDWIAYPVLWSIDGSVHELPNNGRAFVCAINNYGQILGRDGTGSIIWNTDGSATIRHQVQGIDINDLGQVVGTKDGRVVVWDIHNNNTTTVCDGEASKINNARQLIGRYNDRPFFWSEETGVCAIDLPYDDIEWIIADDLNDAGQVVGCYSRLVNEPVSDDTGVLHIDIHLTYGFVWSSTTGFTILGTNDSPQYINNKGQIIGHRSNGLTLWEPVPEPACIVVMIAGLSGLLIRKRTRL